MLIIIHYQSNNIKAVVSLFGFSLYTDNCSNTCRDFCIKFVIYNIFNNQMPSISITSDYQLRSHTEFCLIKGYLEMRRKILYKHLFHARLIFLCLYCTDRNASVVSPKIIISMTSILLSKLQGNVL